MKKVSKLTYSLIGVFIIAFGFIFSSCEKKGVPKPYGYFRIDLPAHTYTDFDSSTVVYQFEQSTLSEIRYRKAEKTTDQWLDIVYPQLRAVIHCTYLPVFDNLNDLSEDSRRIVYQHTVRADAINEKRFENPSQKVYSILYTLSGNVASPVQFIITDSVQHFFRGVLYFEDVPNKDSIAPVASYIHQDIEKLIESFKWKRY